MRGKGDIIFFGGCCVGITPAYAGKSVLPSPGRARQKDHPRVCGEKKALLVRPEPAEGSPPRMRGKVDNGGKITATTGITPAYAGKSPCRPEPRGAPWDHPRVCGEKLSCVWQTTFRVGSPPRMRGKGIQQGNARVTVRITPAYAGKRHGCGATPYNIRDHPRVCGEKYNASVIRNRGTRITPAYAGKS